MSVPVTEAAVQAALYRDETGIEYGVLNDLRIKTAHRLVYRRAEDMLEPLAATAELRLQRRTHTVAVDFVLAPAEPEAGGFINMACHRLMPRNHVGHGVERLELQAMLRVRRSPAGLDPVAETLALMTEAYAAGLDPSRVQIDLTDVHAMAPQRLDAVARVVRMAGAKVVLDISSAGLLMAKPTAAVQPDIVRVGRKRFHAACRETAQADRLRQSLAEFRGRGVTIQIDGIQSRRQFCKALTLRADLYCGEHLSPSCLAGSAFDDAPRSLVSLLGEEGNVLRLFA